MCSYSEPFTSSQPLPTLRPLPRRRGPRHYCRVFSFPFVLDLDSRKTAYPQVMKDKQRAESASSRTQHRAPSNTALHSVNHEAWVAKRLPVGLDPGC